MTDEAPGFEERLPGVIHEFVEAARRDLATRWGAWTFDPAQTEVSEVVAGLLARQVTLATQLALAPQIWNGHVAPLILRAMTDVHITLAWIFKDPAPRAEKYVKYGLGQKKLFLEHFKADLTDRGFKDVDNHPVVRELERSLNAQRFHFLTEVSVGSWAETDTRKMAAEAGCEDLYRFAYSPFSAVVHSTWNHVCDYNLVPCPNPLHAYHRVPVDSDLPAEPDYMYRGAKYLDKTLRLFDEATGVKVPGPSSAEVLMATLDDLVGSAAEDESPAPEEPSES